MTHLQKLKSIRLCLSAHPDNEAGSEFEDRIADLDEMIQAQEDADAALLDAFAKAAMQGIYAAEPNRAAIDPPEYWVGYAYDVAQAMMQERERRMNKG